MLGSGRSRGSGGPGGSRGLRGLAWVIATTGPFILAIIVAAQAQGPTSPEFFEAKVRPVLSTNCYDCHTDQQYGGLRLDSREALLKGGSSGPAIVPGDADKSLLIQAV